MANPQLEDGYTSIANEILERIMRAGLNGTQFRLVLAIWRYTYGFRRKEHELSISFLAQAIGASRSQVDRELKALIERGIIIVVGAGQRGGRVLKFNKNHTEWQDRPLNRGQSKVYSNPSTELYSTLGTEVSPNLSTKKEKTKEKNKYTRQRKTYAEDSTYFKMAKYFYERVSNVAEAEGLGHLTIKADLQKWADEFRKLVELDGVKDKHLIKDVMDWVTTDDFWKTNILSAKKFRQKFGELALKMKVAQKPRQQHQPDPRDKEIAFQRWVAEGNDPNAFDWTT